MSLFTILNNEQRKSFDSPPESNSRERKRYFKFPNGILQIADELRTPTTKVCFLVTYGYFKATNKFFDKQFHEKDIDYVAAKLSISKDQIDLSFYRERIYRKHKKKVLSYCGIAAFNGFAKRLIEKEMTVMVRSQLKPSTTVPVRAKMW